MSVSPMRALRWILVLPGAWAAWTVSLLSGLAVHNAVEALCPPPEIVSGMCTATWFRYTERVLFCAGAGTAAALILLATTLIAPSHRLHVAIATLAAGSLVALVMGLLAHAYAELGTAVVVGALTTAWLLRSRWLRTPAAR